MSIGRSSVRARCPLPFGMLVPQLYRWAKSLNAWLQTFADAPWGGGGSTSTATSVHEFWGKLSVNDSVGEDARFHLTVTHYDKSTPVGRNFWVCTWLASVPYGPPRAAAWTHTMCTGTMVWSQPQAPFGSQPYTKYVLTNASGKASMRLDIPAGAWSGYLHTEINDGFTMVWPLQVKWS